VKKLALIVLLLTVPLFVAPITAAEKTWTALVIYADGHFVSHEDINHERTCREALCQIQDHMSCDEKAEADRKAKEAAKKAAAEREARISAFRVDHPCKTTPDKYKRCPMPDGDETFETEDGLTFGGSDGGTFFTMDSPSTRITKAVCYQ
jgi:hypothetical protein